MPFFIACVHKVGGLPRAITGWSRRGRSCTWLVAESDDVEDAAFGLSCLQRLQQTHVEIAIRGKHTEAPRLSGEQAFALCRSFGPNVGEASLSGLFVPIGPRSIHGEMQCGQEVEAACLRRW